MVSAESSRNGEDRYSQSGPIWSISSCEHVPKTKPWLSIRCFALVGLRRLAASGSSARFLLVVMGFKQFFALVDLLLSVFETGK